MTLAKGLLVGSICAVMAVSGCSVEAVQQAPATSVDECRSNWKIERGASRVAVPEGTDRFDAFMLRIFTNLAGQSTPTDVANSRYRACLVRFGVTNTDDFETAARQGDETAPYIARQAPVRPSYCQSGAGVLYGGSRYCTGRER